MRTDVVLASAPDAIIQTVAILRAGGLVAFPTDTVYGLGALAFDDQAVRSIYRVKGRSDEKAIPVLLASASELERVAVDIPRSGRRLAERFWPGPLTLVLTRQPDLPVAVSATPTVGVRVPNHPVALSILQACGPLAVTSANLSGHPAASTAEEVLEQLSGRIPLILDGGRLPGGTASTVLDCTRAEPTVLRAGPLTLDDLQAALSDYSPNF